ncbi:4Fe-4S binding protein [Massilia sp. RP-1-19]|uniref:4Fe-4S binding protein n=1 Tax=Massilia polaris TaxID=2728846 RepID=A0A848HNC0_9BURK|nr:4Fe-4S binding protein [Massilia polaris]NML62762.1 4Fe-4S binding protein [Massilia polaris]
MNDRPGIDWVQEHRNAAARAAALAVAPPPPSDSLQTVAYTSAGKTLIIGSAEIALKCADQLCGVLPVTVLLTSPGGVAAQPAPRSYSALHCSEIQVSGWLGAFDARWRDAGRGVLRREGRFDLVLDLSAIPLIPAHQKPHGYFAPGSSEPDIATAIGELAQMIGEFEKPKYFRYKDRLCAHSRNGQTGCTACIDICSARAIASAGDLVRVNPYLCAGCGACTTACPTGALAYAYPGAPYTGDRLRAVLASYKGEGGLDPVILFHGAGHGTGLVSALDANSEGQPYGMPARVIPMELHHMASTGIDVWLTAVAYGASGISVLVTESEAPQYAEALEDQMGMAQEILSGLGYAGVHFQLVRAATPGGLGEALANAPAGIAPQQSATFHVAQEKRNALDMALDHLFRHATLQPEYVPLPPRSPFGAIAVDKGRCTLCMSCVGACPSSALMDSDTAPQLRFVEKNCVQCGLCANTCPEDAISLLPRMSFADTRNKTVLLNETEPFCCIRCNKPFGTLLMIQSMLGKLSQHSAFQGNLDRIRMCGDCRVIDMMQSNSPEGGGSHR